MRAQVQAAAAARDRYDDAISMGHTPVLGSSSAKGAFEIALGNLAPGKEMSVTVQVLAQLTESEESGSLFFGIPEQIFPAAHVLYALSLSVTTAGQRYTEASVICNGESVAFSGDGFRKTFEAGNSCRGLFALELTPALQSVTEPSLVIEDTGATVTAEVTVCPVWPPNDSYAPVAEVFLLMDRSGSMVEKDRLAAARETALLFVSSLPPLCKFQIVGFGSRYTLLFPRGAQLLTAATLAQAQLHIASM